MSSRIKKSLSKTEVRFWLFRLLAFGLLGLGFAGWLIADEQHISPDLTVHEWGTFTAIAGEDGRAVEWTPYTGPTDLPGFVEHLSGANLKPGLRGTIRMETPVLYFYSPRDVTVSVRVAFSKGVITEWYPRAARVQPSGMLRNASLRQLQADGSITWNDVAVSPNLSGEFPREVSSSRYYAARETSSAPLLVKTAAGEQQEKFLFYRGVSAARLPLSARLKPDGKLVVKNLSRGEIPTVILFERRGERVGYRLAGALKDETVFDPPVLTGSVDALCSDLEGMLVDQGLYPDEAQAMVETWRDSWFEEGSRLIYLVPRGFIDNVLPLAIDPAPGQIVRVFVGRLEIVTPATTRAVATAVAHDDEVTLNKYGRFLGTDTPNVGSGGIKGVRSGWRPGFRLVRRLCCGGGSQSIDGKVESDAPAVAFLGACLAAGIRVGISGTVGLGKSKGWNRGGRLAKIFHTVGTGGDDCGDEWDGRGRPSLHDLWLRIWGGRPGHLERRWRRHNLVP